MTRGERRRTSPVGASGDSSYSLAEARSCTPRGTTSHTNINHSFPGTQSCFLVDTAGIGSRDAVESHCTSSRHDCRVRGEKNASTTPGSRPGTLAASICRGRRSRTSRRINYCTPSARKPEQTPSGGMGGRTTIATSSRIDAHIVRYSAQYSSRNRIRCIRRERVGAWFVEEPEGAEV